jgi:selenocysteine lyase/cysteine desulfurase
MDVQAWGCDALGCSAYKFFGPHIGILWARRQILEELPVYKLRPSSDALPDRWMTGTQNHECIAGVAAAVDYLEDLGRHCGHKGDRRIVLRGAMTEIQRYETELGRHLLEGLAPMKRFQVWGISDLQKLSQRVPTISITKDGTSAETMARHLAAREIYAWNGNMYAINLTERLGLESKGGFLRLGLVHYNTHEEVEKVLQASGELA